MLYLLSGESAARKAGKERKGKVKYPIPYTVINDERLALHSKSTKIRKVDQDELLIIYSLF